MKTLGVVGGIAPASTIEYYRMLVATYQLRRPDGSNPPVIINSIDMQTMLRLIAADALDEVTEYLGAEIDKLVQAGADVVSVAPEDRPLEDVYFALVGQSAGEEPSQP